MEYQAPKFPWENNFSEEHKFMEYFDQLQRLKKAGKLEDLEAVKQIKIREGYISIQDYFKILERWDWYEEQFNLFVSRDRNKAKWLGDRLSKNSFWAVRIARFITENNKSDNPEDDLYFCLRDQDVLLYIEWLLSDRIFKGQVEIICPIKVSEVHFLDPAFRVTRENTDELFPEVGDYREVYHDSVVARRLRDTMTLLLSPGMMKSDKVKIINYLVNKEVNGSNNIYLGRYPKKITYRVWKSLLGKQNLLLLPIKDIELIYNTYKKNNPLNGGLGSVIKRITNSRVRPPTEKYSKYSRITKAEQERLDIWTQKLKNQRKERP